MQFSSDMLFDVDVGVSKNSGTPKWMVYKKKKLLELMVWWGKNPYLWKHPCDTRQTPAFRWLKKASFRLTAELPPRP